MQTVYWTAIAVIFIEMWLVFTMSPVTWFKFNSFAIVLLAIVSLFGCASMGIDVRNVERAKLQEIHCNVVRDDKAC